MAYIIFSFQKKAKQQKRLVPEPHSAALEVAEDSGDAVAGLSDEASTIPYVQTDSFSSFLDNLDRIEVGIL